MENFKKIMQLVLRLDEMKTVLRQTRIIGQTQREDDAQHSYHISSMAVLLEKYANEPIHLEKVLTMLLFHDVVELEVGDTFCYDEEANIGKFDREYKAARTLYHELPEELGEKLLSYWLEFEKGESAEAKFAIALDRCQPVLNNYFGGGGSWTAHKISYNQVLQRIAPAKEGCEALYIYIVSLIDDARNKGWLTP